MNALPKPRVNPWIVTCAVMLSTFMEILDTTVVNSSIPHIAGNLSSTVDEGTWVVTSYLVANAIILPMTGWLSNFFGRKRLLLVATASFTATSVMCGLATSLDALIAFRVLQGLSGGCMQPLAQSILLETFPPKQHGQAMAAFSLGILLAPIIGPALGGWITDNYSWRWIFYLNVPIGILSMVLVTNFVFDPDYLARVARRVDGWGIGLLALWIGALQIVLDTGQKHDWFESNEIRVWAVLCVGGLIAFLVREFTCEDPVVDLRVFLDRTFAAGALLITTIGFMLYASLVLLPIYLQTLLGYPAFDAGLAISPRGLGALFMMPICGMLIGKVPSRLLIAIGLVLGGATMFQFARLNLQAGYWDIFWPQVFQGFGMAFLFIPITTMSVSHIAKPKMGNATSIFNLVRNIGGSFGIALMTTFLARRSQLHVNHLGENVSIYDVHTQQMIAAMRAFFISRGADAATAGRQSLAAIYGMVQQHAAMKAFVEAFWIMSILFVAVIPLVFLMTEQHKRKVAVDATAHPPTPPAPPATEPKEEEERELAHV
jgi:MFS transporter, DHA2 family, multidrug resistance protein